jgi:hypothetical protein
VADGGAVHLAVPALNPMVIYLDRHVHETRGLTETPIP